MEKCTSKYCTCHLNTIGTVEVSIQAKEIASETQTEILSKIAAELENIRMIQQTQFFFTREIDCWKTEVGKELPRWQWEMLLALMERLDLPSPSEDPGITPLAENRLQE